MGWEEGRHDAGGGLVSGKTPSFAHVVVIRAPDLHTVIVLELATPQSWVLNMNVNM